MVTIGGTGTAGTFTAGGTVTTRLKRFFFSKVFIMVVLDYFENNISTGSNFITTLNVV